MHEKRYMLLGDFANLQCIQVNVFDIVSYHMRHNQF